MSRLLLEPLGFKGICIAPPLKFGFMRKDDAAFRAFIARVVEWDFDRIIVTHGEIITERAKETFAGLMRRFTD